MKNALLHKMFFKLQIIAALFLFGLGSGSMVLAQTYTQSSIAYSWDAPGTNVSITSCDDCGFVLTLPFTFTFFGTNYTQVTVSANALMTMGNSPTDWNAWTNTCLPNSATPNNLIASYWDDLYFDYGCAPTYWRYQTFGTTPNRRFVVGWTAFRLNGGSCGTYVYTEIKLFETTNVIEVHLQSNALGSGGTIGIENSGGTTGYQAICNSATTNGTAWRWTPVSDPCASVISIGGCGAGFAQTYTNSGPGSWSPIFCGFGTPDMEWVYSFVAPTTGIYSIQVTAASTWVDYGWRASSCASGGWTCISDVNSPGTYGSMSWTAGTTYYILLDGEPGAGNHTFYLNCPPAGCIAGSPYLTVTAPTNNVELEISTCTYAGEYNTIQSVVSGQTYSFRSSTATDYLTLTNTSNSVLVFGTTPISWVASFSGDVRLHIHTNSSCGTESVCRATYIQCTSCPPPCTAPGATTFLSHSNTTTSITWNWNAATGSPDFYEISLDGGAWTNIGLVLTYTGSPFTANTQHRLNVRANKACGAPGTAMGDQWFYTSQNTPTSIIFSGIIGNTITVTANGTFPNQASGISGVYIRNATAVTNSGWMTATTSWVSGSLSCGTTYSFYAKARNGDGDETTEIGPTNQATTACPGSVTLNNPFDNYRKTYNIDFDWTATPANQYNFQVDDNYSFASPVFNVNQAGNTYTISAGLLNGYTYYWRVRASNDGGFTFSSFSAIRSFTYDAAITTADWYQNVYNQLLQGTSGGTNPPVVDNAEADPPTDNSRIQLPP